jgi:hypothetical protein
VDGIPLTENWVKVDGEELDYVNASSEMFGYRRLGRNYGRVFDGNYARR